MRGFKRLVLGLLLCALWVLGGCNLVELRGETVAAVPNLGLLQMEPYVEEGVETTADSNTQDGHTQVDLWLDASQGMGGINTSEKTMYPHIGRRFREGGFHYHYGNGAGWYESVLIAMMEAAEGSRLRVLRFGNERLPEAYLKSRGVAPAEITQDQLRSLRRDMLTYAITPNPALFTSLSAEDMAGSFYALGSPTLNQMASFAQAGGAELENPGKAQAMDQALAAQVEAIEAGQGQAVLATRTKDENDYPLLYALDNIDLSRLSVVVVDPAGIRSLSGTSLEGEPLQYVERLLSQRRVFDRGLTAGLYAFQLDYMGQMSSIGEADLAEPLIWGRPIYNLEKRVIDYVAPMPRIAMALVIGRPGQVTAYMDKLNAKLEGNAGLNGLRGPVNGELTYARDGATVTQQPFTFAYWHTQFSRPDAGYYTQHSQGAALGVSQGEGSVVEQNGLQTVLLAPGKKGEQEDRTLTLTFPLRQDDAGAQLDLSQLQAMRAEVLSAITLTETLPNTALTQRDQQPDEQVLALRDKLYVYQRREEPFADTPQASPFTLASLALSPDGKQLVCTLQVEGPKLQEGYYRVQLLADLTAQEVAWLPVDWIDGTGGIGASIGSEDVLRWETFAAAVAKYDSNADAIPKNLTHAWGPYTDKPYHGIPVPDCPPVEKAIALRELAAQFRQAATAQQSALMRYVFDVFVDNRDAALAALAQ